VQVTKVYYDMLGAILSISSTYCKKQKPEEQLFRLDTESTGIQENVYDRTGTVKQSGSSIMAMVILYCYTRALLSV
jgi:hypothetical protein